MINDIEGMDKRTVDGGSKSNIHSSVRLKQRSAESTYYSFPGLAVKRNITKSRHCLHVCDAHPTAAPRTCPRRRLAAAHLPLLVHKKAETNH